MARPHRAAVFEDAWNRRLVTGLTRRGWCPRVVPFAGYGSAGFLRVMGRVLLTRGVPPEDVERVEDAERRAHGESLASDESLARGESLASDGSLARGESLWNPGQEQRLHEVVAGRSLRPQEDLQRGWRAFISAPAVNHRVTIVVKGRRIEAEADRSGLIDVTVRGHGLAPGWHEVRIEIEDGAPVDAPVLVVGSSQSFGIVCDIDDTILSTSLPRPLVAGWNTFVKTEATRRPVPGMAPLLRRLIDDHPGAPLVFVSTGAWNTAPLLGRFLRRNGFPIGPMLLTDWGPTSTGWFRSGREHKQACLHRLARELPHISWVLVGDDGQHDPTIYAEFAAQRPDAVRLIALRELTAAQQALSHVIPVATDGHTGQRAIRDVPVVRGVDGYALLPEVLQALDDTPAGTPAARVEDELSRTGGRGPDGSSADGFSADEDGDTFLERADA